MQETISQATHTVNPDEGTRLALLSPKDIKWDDRRGETQSVEQLYTKRSDFARLAERMAKCSGLLEFRQVIHEDTGEASLKLSRASFCHVRHCPVCQWRRGLRNVARFYEALPQIQQDHPKAAWLFLTLTVRNPPMSELRATLGAMNKAWQRLIQRADWPALGFIRTTELTLGRDGNPHPHFHALLMVKPSYFKSGNYLSQEAWTRHWQEALRADYTPMVNIQRVKARSAKAQLAEQAGDAQAALGAAVLETVKYSVKPSDLIADAAFLYGITEQLHKTRFIASGGALKKALVQDKATDKELVEAGSVEEPEAVHEAPELGSVFFGWKRDKRQYRQV